MDAPIEVDLNVLGLFQARRGASEVPLGGPLQRLVLARLVVADVVLSADKIVTDIWGDRAVGLTPGTLHSYVSRLRKLLGQDALPRRTDGYALDRTRVSVDAQHFVDEVELGRRALSRADDAAGADLLRRALARWRGPHAFGGLRDAPFLAAETARLESMRVSAAEMLADATTRAGQDHQDIPLLEELAETDPLRESLAIRLIHALDGAGRPADALTAYERCRGALADELGVDPTPALREAHASVLAQNRCLPTPALTNLPPRNRSFVGRAALLATLEQVLDEDWRTPKAVVLTGMAGIGKTEIALQLCYRRARTGRVTWWISAQDPTTIATGLAELAAALGIDARPREPVSRLALWTALDRLPGWVLVFDNAEEPGLIAPFLPVARHGEVIVTSRNPAWRRLAHPVPIPVMDRHEAISYLVSRSGQSDSESAHALAEILGDLPLALEQAGAYIEQTGTTIEDYLGLYRRNRPTMLLRATDDGRSIAATWGLTFDQLHDRRPLATAILETAAFLSADAIDIALLAPLAAGELEFHDAIAELLRFSLVDRQSTTLRMHRLLQDVVRARMTTEAFRQRLTQTTELCTRVLDFDTTHVATHLAVLGGHCEACGYLPSGLPAALSAAARSLTDRALYPSAVHLLRQALRLISRSDAHRDPAERGALICQLGEVLDASGLLEEALKMHRKAVALLASVVGHDDLRAHAQNRFGHVLNCADRPDEAIAAHERALAIVRGAGRDDLLAPILIDLGYTLWATGRLGGARAALMAGLALLTQEDGRTAWQKANATAGLGMVAQDTGDLDEAAKCHRAAIAGFTELCGSDHPDTAQALDKLGYTLRLQGHLHEAMATHLRVVRLLERRLGPSDPRVAMALSNLGLDYADVGRHREAVAAQSRAYAIFAAAVGPHHSSTRMASGRWAAAAEKADPPAQRLLDTVEANSAAATA